MPASYYDTLRVPHGASQADIRQSYRRMVGQWHPDNWLQREQALGDLMFRSLAEAFSMLSDPAMRALYDRSLAGEPATRSQAAVDSDAALRIFNREMQGFAAELSAQGLAPDDVARYLGSLGVPARAARALCGLETEDNRGAGARRLRRGAALTLLGLTLVLGLVFTAVWLRAPEVGPVAPPPVAQPAPAVPSASPAPTDTGQTPGDAPTPAQLSAREFNRMMAEFEQRHPEFDPKSPKYDANATESLRRRIEALEAKGYESPEALRQAMSEYERLVAARAAAAAQPAPPPRAASSANAPAPRSGAAGVPSNPPPPDGDALRTLCETFPHACRR